MRPYRTVQREPCTRNWIEYTSKGSKERSFPLFDCGPTWNAGAGAGIKATIPKNTFVKTHDTPLFSHYPTVVNKDEKPARTTYKVDITYIEPGIPGVRPARVHWGQRQRRSAKLSDVFFLEGIEKVAEFIMSNDIAI